MIQIKCKGDYTKTFNFLRNLENKNYLKNLEKYAIEGVTALASATPKDSGLTASSWSYKIVKTNKSYSIEWFNSNIEGEVPVAILLQYGHGTKNGGYVLGRDYINPAMRPIFDKIADNAWREVINI